MIFLHFSEWEKEIKKAAAENRKASYVRALVGCFGWSYFQVGLLAAIEECILRSVLLYFWIFYIISTS